MRPCQALLAALAIVSLASGCGGRRGITAGGVLFTVPSGWHQVQAAAAEAVTDQRTLLVVGTAGVHAKPSRCQIAAYRIPAAGAAVVAVGWTSVASAGGGAPPPGRAPLNTLTTVHRANLECSNDRSAVAQLRLDGQQYQVNVVVGNRASKARVAEALAIARSFDRSN